MLFYKRFQLPHLNWVILHIAVLKRFKLTEEWRTRCRDVYISIFCKHTSPSLTNFLMVVVSRLTIFVISFLKLHLFWMLSNYCFCLKPTWEKKMLGDFFFRNQCKINISLISLFAKILSLFMGLVTLSTLFFLRYTIRWCDV